MKPDRLTLLLLTAVFELVLLGPERLRCADAADFTVGFDGEQTSWRVSYNKSNVRMLKHRRNEHIYLKGGSSENLEFRSTANSQFVQLEHQLPLARVIDDLKASLWVRSNRSGGELSLRVVFPHQKDPRTGAVLPIFVRGSTYTSAGEWQQLQCTTLEKEIRDQLLLVRYRLNNPHIDIRDAYVDGILFTAPLGPGTTEFFLDELRFGPIVSPRDAEPIAPADDEGPPVEFRLDRLLVEGHPFFPRIAPFHSEEIDLLKASGLNVVWVPATEDERFLANLRHCGLWAMATPPRVSSAAGEFLDPRTVSLVPFTQRTAPILFWYVGTRVPPQARHELIAWNKQIREADRHFHRPLVADVTGAERVFSRHVAMLGVSRHVINTTFPLKRYRDWLLHKRKIARPGSFVWTWIQTEASSTNAKLRRAAHKIPIVVEPEQIRLQVYAALAAGCRGIGYWKTASFDADVPGGSERQLAIMQLNLELELLEPWLATGRLEKQVRFDVQQPQTSRTGQRQLGFGNSTQGRQDQDAVLRVREDHIERSTPIAGALEAAIIRTDYGTLLLPVWYDHDAQFVPGQMAANDVTIVVEGVDESASAWEVSTTGIRSLARRRVTGGIRITLKKFDQTAAVIVTSNRTRITDLRNKTAGMAEKSSRVSIDLAIAKLERVRRVDEELRSLGVGQPDAPQLLGKAFRETQLAQQAHQRGDYHDARLLSANAMQLLRILQRAHWNNAVRHLASPASSPHTICFQTLPDHWRMVAALGRSRSKVDGNVLRSGDFEDIHTMIVEGWKHVQTRLDGVRAAAELYPDARNGKYCLRLVAVPATGSDPPTVINRSPVQVTTPPLTVRSGQIIHVSGWVRVVAAPLGSLDGAMLYDSLSGPAGALRWYERCGWKRFELIREVQASGPFTLTLALNGLGELQLDDLRVIPHNPRTDAIPGDSLKNGGDTRPGTFNFLNRLPKWNPLSPRK